ncbi:TPA: FUSC family protein [Legionella anisa]
MQVISKTIHAVKDEILLWPLIRGIIVLLPFAFLYLHTNNPRWLQSSVLTMATLIVEERLALTALGVLLHGSMIIAMFYLLFLTQLKPVLYVVSCSLAATIVIWVTIKGEKLRPLGSWTFIPAIILATEFAAETKPATMVYQAPQFLPYLVFALIPTLLIAQVDKMRAFYKKRVTHYHPLRLGGLNDFGEKKPYIESLIAMALAVFISAFLVEYLQMENGQWMIWGAASIVTGNITTTPQKLRQRFTGVSIGVPLGILLGQFIPNTPFDLTFAVCGVFLTLVAFRRYAVAYTFRCFFVTTAVILATQSVSVASERFTHVILGGLVGFMCVMICHFCLLYTTKK